MGHNIPLQRDWGGGGGVMAASSSLMAYASLFDKSNLEVSKARLAMSKCTARADHLSDIHHVALGFITLL